MPNLTFADNNSLRELTYLVNGYTHDTEDKLNRLDLEEKLIKLKEKATQIEGKELTEVKKEIDKVSEYLMILDTIDERNVHFDAATMDKLEEQEIQRAESNAVLIAHFMRLQKYYGEGYLEKYIKGSNRLIKDIQRGSRIYKPLYEKKDRTLILTKKEPDQPSNNTAGRMQQLQKVKRVQQKGMVYERKIDEKLERENPFYHRVKKYNPPPV